MKLKKIHDTKKLTLEQWKEVRRGGITGSRIAGIMHLSPWETPRSVYYDLLGIRPDKQETEPMYWGTVLEDIVAKEFSKRTGFKVRKVNYVLQHPIYDFLLGNIDRLIIDGNEKGVLECKNVGAFKESEWLEGPPIHYVCQLQFYLALTGLPFGYLCALIGGQKFIYYKLERDDALIKQMLDAATDFWFGHVLDKVEPPVTERDTEILNQVFQVEPDKVAYLEGNDHAVLVRDLMVTKERLGTAKAAHELAKNRIKDVMMEAELLMFQGQKVATWKADIEGKRKFMVKV